jgi:hypothetical protein
MKTIFKFFFYLFFTIFIIGCCPDDNSEKPDLRPEKNPLSSPNSTDPFAYCNLDGNNELIIVIKNIGSEDAPATVTKIEFVPVEGHFSGSSIEIPTPPIPAGESATLGSVSFPGGCYQPDCHFIITADFNNELDERNEENNKVNGYCIG